jgi:hypothetical protein
MSVVRAQDCYLRLDVLMESILLPEAARFRRNRISRRTSMDAFGHIAKHVRDRQLLQFPAMARI